MSVYSSRVIKLQSNKYP